MTARKAEDVRAPDPHPPCPFCTGRLTEGLPPLLLPTPASREQFAAALERYGAEHGFTP